jgi:hypothetical protein
VAGNRERRRPGHFRICGACGKRNKARRAECSRCGEPLRGIPEATPGTLHAPPPPPRKYRWLVAAVVVVAIAAGVVVNRIFTTGSLGSAAPTAEASPQDIPSAEPIARPSFDPTSSERYAQVRGSVERGQRLLARGDFRGAASLLADAARLVPEDPKIANAYGRALLGLGSRDRALHQFERAARLDTGVTAYRIDYARALAEAGRGREAAREYEAVAAIEPGNAAASEGLARIQQGAPSTSSGSTGVDLGGASSGAAPAPASGGAFTNEDLARGVRPMRPSSPSPSPSPRPLSPSPSPYTGPFASPSPG